MTDEIKVTSFKQLFSPARQTLDNISKLNGLFREITDNILKTIHDPMQQEQALVEAAQDWRQLIGNLDTLNKEKDDGVRVQETINDEGQVDTDQPDTSISETDSGETTADTGAGDTELRKSSQTVLIFKADDHWRWLGIPTNNFNDRHGHVIKAEAHQEFVDAIHKGDWFYPFLMIKHLQAPIGRADFVDFDPETGMVYAGGYFYDEWSHLAEGMSTYEVQQGMSHAMPPALTYWEKKLGSNPQMPAPGSIIKRYRSVEYSIMPTIDAANILTSVNAF